MKSGLLPSVLDNSLAPVVPFVSVIVPTYNRERLLCDTLRDLLGQDYPHLEFLVMDQSPVHEAATEQFLASVKDRIRHFRFSPPNLPAARNFGIRNSRGQIIAFVDDDMVLPSHTISAVVSTYSDPDVWGVTPFVVGRSHKEEEKYVLYRPYARRNELWTRDKVRIPLFQGCFMSFRRELFDHVGYFDEWLGTQSMAAGYGEDGEFCERVRKRGFGLYLNTAITTRHLADREGGCGRRRRSSHQIYLDDFRVATYVAFKNRGLGRLGWMHALWRCYRQFFLNRSLLRPALVSLRRRHEMMWKAVREAERVLAANHLGGNAPGNLRDPGLQFSLPPCAERNRES